MDAYVHEWQISPRANLQLRLNEGTDVHAGYSRYFSPPPFELVAPKDLAEFQGTSNAATVNADSNVRSEDGTTITTSARPETVPKLSVRIRRLLQAGQKFDR